MGASCAAFTIRGLRTSGRHKSFRAIAPRRVGRRGRRPSPSPNDTVSQVVVFLALAFSILIAIFAVQNTTAVAVQFLTFHSDSVAVSVLVLISAALGAAVMLFLGVWREASMRWRNRAVAQQLRAAQARVAELEAAQPVPPPALTTTAEKLSKTTESA